MSNITMNTIGEMFDAAVAKYADREALRYQGEGITYSQLAENVNGMAKGLIDLGVNPGDKVGIWMPNCPEWIYTNMAITKIGAVTVPINIRFKPREVEYIIKNANIATLIMADKFLSNHFSDILYEICPELQDAPPGNLNSEKFGRLKNIICLNKMPGMLEFNTVIEKGKTLALDDEMKRRQAEICPEDVVNVFYTSGTTGRPKGAMANHKILGNIKNYIDWLEITEGDVFQVPSPLFYTTANYWCMLCPMMAGAKMVLATYFTLEEKLEQIEKEKITITVGMAKMWIDMTNFLKTHPHDTSSLRIVWTGGGPISTAELQEVRNNIVDQIIGLYGMTETGGITMMTKVGDPLPVLSSTIGTPLPDFILKIIDPETGKELPCGKSGELCVKGPYVINGYLNASKDDENSPFDEDGWFHTQDLLIKNENGYYSFVGRIKDMIKVGGENVSLNEIDDYLRSHDKIKMACSIGVPDQAKQEVPLAFIETVEGQELTEQDIFTYCKGKIASYKIPKHIRFTKDWPTTATGKIQRFILKELVEDEFSQ